MFTLNLLVILFSLNIYADSSTVSGVHDVEYGQGHQHSLLFLNNGMVLKLKDHSFLPLKGRRVKVSWNKKRLITDLEIINEQEKVFQSDLLPESFEPSVINGGRRAKKYFSESRMSRGETQCFNRAHVWSYELWKRHQIKSRKIFLFFSRKYIRQHDFGWWFHVAPLIITDQWDGKVEEVIDPKFLRAPRDIQWWTDKFVSSHETCREISQYSDYADYPYSRDCFVMKVPMYIYQPLDLEMLEVWGIPKNDFARQDLEWAYKEAFNINFEGGVP